MRERKKKYEGEMQRERETVSSIRFEHLVGTRSGKGKCFV